MNKKLLVIVSISAVLFISCKQQERIVKQNYKSIRTEEEIEKLIFSGRDEIKTIKLTKIHFNIDANGDHYESGGNIAIIRDSVIVISLVPLMGLEIARIYCFQDSILIIDRHNKTYTYEPYKTRLGKFYVQGEYNDIESIISGRAFIYENETNEKHCKKSIITEEEYLKYRYELIEQNSIKSRQDIMVKKSNLMIESNEVTDHKNRLNLMINYGQFKQVDDFIMPHEIKMSLNSTNEKMDINMTIGNSSLNQEINANIIITDKYEKINSN